jgi:uncharacterized protein YciI
MPRTLHLLRYEYVPDMATRRQPYREAHLELIAAYHADGRLEIAGGIGDPVRGGLLAFRDEADAHAFAQADPYRAVGLVAASSVEPWVVVTPEM